MNAQFKKCMQMIHSSPLLSLYLRSDEGFREHIHRRINFAIDTLKREDRIVWYMRQLKYHEIIGGLATMRRAVAKQGTFYGLSKQQCLPEQTHWQKDLSFLRHLVKKGTAPPPEQAPYGLYIADIHATLQHIADMNIEPLNRIEFAWQSADEIKEIAEKIEARWHLNRGGESVDEYGTRLIGFSDGSAWFDLERSGCTIEAEAMRHCGNGLGASGDTLLSFRTPDRQRPGCWRPHLTFILNTSEGALGEMKGFANSKPAQKYHEAIVRLLIEDERITSIVGGGYKQENNFSLQDLDPRLALRLFKARPSLFNLADLQQLNTKHPDLVDLRQIAAQRLRAQTDRLTLDGTEHFIIEADQELKGLAARFELPRLAEYEQTLRGGRADLDVDGGDWGCAKEHFSEILSSLLEQDTQLKLRLERYLKTQYHKAISARQLDISSSARIVDHLCAQRGDVLCERFGRAHASAIKGGANKALSEALATMLKTFFIDPEFQLAQTDQSERYHTVITVDGLLKMIGRAQKCYRGAIRSGDNELIFAREQIALVRARDLNVLHEGGDGWSRDAAKECLRQGLKEALNEWAKINPAMLRQPFESPGQEPDRAQSDTPSFGSPL